MTRGADSREAEEMLPQQPADESRPSGIGGLGDPGAAQGKAPLKPVSKEQAAIDPQPSKRLSSINAFQNPNGEKRHNEDCTSESQHDEEIGG